MFIRMEKSSFNKQTCWKSYRTSAHVLVCIKKIRVERARARATIMQAQ